MAKKEYIIKKKKYMIITALIMLLFVLFLSILKLSYDTMNQPKETNEISKKSLEDKEKQLKSGGRTDKKEFPFCIYVTEETDGNRANYEQALKDLKLPYIVCHSFDEVTGDVLEQAKVILIGDNIEKLGSISKLEAFLSYEISVVFTKMPETSVVMETSLSKIMGIRKIEGIEKQKGVRLLERFLLGGRVDLEKYEYEASVVKLMNTGKVYLCALPEKDNPLKIKNEDLNPLLWRNTYEKRKIFTINGPFLRDSNVTGFLAAIFSEILEDYLYPVINEVVFAIENFPYYTNVTSKELQNLYSRDALLLQRDILWPDVISMGKREDFDITYYAAEHFTKGEQAIAADIKKQQDFYEESLKRSGGHLFSMKDFQSFEEEVYAPVAFDSFYLNDNQIMKYYSVLTAYGAIIYKINMEDIVFPKNSNYDWVKASKSMKENVGYYMNNYKEFSPKNVEDAAIAARAYKVCNPIIEYGTNKIHVFTGDKKINYSFILRTEKKVKEIDFGKVKELEKGAYLVTITSDEATIYLEENTLRTYEKSNPYKGLEELW